jgi:putative ABC transport system ATP-binding protein
MELSSMSREQAYTIDEHGMKNQKIIHIKNVFKSFPLAEGEVTVLKGVSFEVSQGEFLAIVGPSGNGKSTLLNMITGIDRPTSGDVIVQGKRVHQMNEEELAVWRGRQVGIVFQFFQLLPALSLLQNIILPMDLAKSYPVKERRTRAMELLEMVGLADQAHKLPSAVSGGQQQRAAIARALANDPPLLVADEPTGNLDARTSDEVFGLFSCLVDTGKTMIMVTHNADLANQVPRVIEIVNGVILYDSQRSALMTAKMVRN